jgi:uncharacterized peroxidase-related enzyme
MAFIQTIPLDEASGPLKEMYDAELQTNGSVDHTAQAFSLRPAVYMAWTNLLGDIRANLDVRRYELVTIVAASRLRCSYCTLAHGEVLRSRFFSATQVEAIVQDFRHAGLEPAEVAMLAYAEKIILHAYKVTPEEIDGLRAHGFSDADILDIALTAAARSFISKMIDAVGAEPDEKYMEVEPALRQTLTVGRPFG